jgi:hypothetical protein
MGIAACQSCGGRRLAPFLDLGHRPIADVLLDAARLAEPEEKLPNPSLPGDWQ